MKILIADDDFATREVLRRILASMADQVFEARNGVEALELIERADPDVLFTDVHMPLLDGIAVVEAVRSSASHASLPVVCMSSGREKEHVTRLVTLGIADYILKPLRPAELYDRVRRLIAENGHWRRQSREQGNGAVMLIDPDQRFREFAAAALEEKFLVYRAVSGADALRAYNHADTKPATALVADGLRFVSDVQLVRLMSKLAVASMAPVPTFWLVSDREGIPDTLAPHFAGCIKRSFVPETFRAEVARLLPGAALVASAA